MRHGRAHQFGRSRAPTIFGVCVNGGPGSDESGRTRKEIGPGVMEILIVLGSLAALATAVWVPWALLLEGGAALAAFGLLMSHPRVTPPRPRPSKTT